MFPIYTQNNTHIRSKKINAILGILWKIKSPVTLDRNVISIYIMDTIVWPENSFYEESIRTILIADRNNEHASDVNESGNVMRGTIKR